MAPQTESPPEPNRSTPLPTADALADEGKLLELLDYLESPSNDYMLRESLPWITRCIRTRATSDLDGLAEDLFSRALSLAATLFVKADLHIRHRLAESHRRGDPAFAPLPQDMIEGGWIARTEKLTRFFCDLLSLRARIHHVAGMGGGKERSSSRTKSNGFGAVGLHRGQTLSGAAFFDQERVDSCAEDLAGDHGVDAPFP